MSMTFGADAAIGVRPCETNRARPNARDILDDLLSDHDDTPVPGLEGLDRLLKSVAAPLRREAPPAPVGPVGPVDPDRQAERPAPKLSVMPARKPVKWPMPRRKTTQYLTEEIFARLEEARDQLDARTQGRISKSGIVNAALALALAELESRGEHSRLARNILSGTDRKE